MAQSIKLKEASKSFKPSDQKSFVSSIEPNNKKVLLSLKASFNEVQSESHFWSSQEFEAPDTTRHTAGN